eukprot:GHVT01088786.1.p1 GENE.GHVT01088786.1~~GHVT01088786.1.p1  ORF type:complete len:1275 (+),score=267.90 GHVT01088786.1:1082-4906(+)
MAAASESARDESDSTVDLTYNVDSVRPEQEGRDSKAASALTSFENGRLSPVKLPQPEGVRPADPRRQLLELWAGGTPQRRRSASNGHLLGVSASSSSARPSGYVSDNWPLAAWSPAPSSRLPVARQVTRRGYRRRAASSDTRACRQSNRPPSNGEPTSPPVYSKRRSSTYRAGSAWTKEGQRVCRRRLFGASGRSALRLSAFRAATKLRQAAGHRGSVPPRSSTTAAELNPPNPTQLLRSLSFVGSGSGRLGSSGTCYSIHSLLMPDGVHVRPPPPLTQGGALRAALVSRRAAAYGIRRNLSMHRRTTLPTPPPLQQQGIGSCGSSIGHRPSLPPPSLGPLSAGSTRLSPAAATQQLLSVGVQAATTSDRGTEADGSPTSSAAASDVPRHVAPCSVSPCTIEAGALSKKAGGESSAPEPNACKAKGGSPIASDVAPPSSASAGWALNAEEEAEEAQVYEAAIEKFRNGAANEATAMVSAFLRRGSARTTSSCDSADGRAQAGASSSGRRAGLLGSPASSASVVPVAALSGVVLSAFTHQFRRRQDALEGWPPARHVRMEVLMGHLMFEQQTYLDALRHYWRSVDVRPSQASLFYNLGLAYYEIQQLDDAVHALQHALTIEPDCVKTLAVLSIILMERHAEKQEEEADAQELLENEIEAAFHDVLPPITEKKSTIISQHQAPFSQAPAQTRGKQAGDSEKRQSRKSAEKRHSPGEKGRQERKGGGDDNEAAFRKKDLRGKVAHEHRQIKGQARGKGTVENAEDSSAPNALSTAVDACGSGVASYFYSTVSALGAVWPGKRAATAADKTAVTRLQALPREASKNGPAGKQQEHTREPKAPVPLVENEKERERRRVVDIRKATEPSVAMLRRCLELEPDNRYVQRHLAQVHLYREEWESSEVILCKLLKRLHAPAASLEAPHALNAESIHRRPPLIGTGTTDKGDEEKLERQQGQMNNAGENTPEESEASAPSISDHEKKDPDPLKAATPAAIDDDKTLGAVLSAGPATMCSCCGQCACDGSPPSSSPSSPSSASSPPSSRPSLSFCGCSCGCVRLCLGSLGEYRVCVSSSVEAAELLRALGRVCYNRGFSPLALLCFEGGLRVCPGAALLYHDVCEVYCGQGCVTDALAAFERCLESDPDNVRVHATCGVPLCDAGLEKEVLRLYAKFIKKHPRSTAAKMFAKSLGAVNVDEDSGRASLGIVAALILPVLLVIVILFLFVKTPNTQLSSRQPQTLVGNVRPFNPHADLRQSWGTQRSHHSSSGYSVDPHSVEREEL